MICKARIEIEIEVSKLLIRRGELKEVQLIIAMKTNDPLMVGPVQEMNLFVKDISKKFEISKAVIGDRTTFNECDTFQHEFFYIGLCISRSLAGIKPINVE